MDFIKLLFFMFLPLQLLLLLANATLVILTSILKFDLVIIISKIWVLFGFICVLLRLLDSLIDQRKEQEET